jgi:hypothetical protein
MERTMLNKLAIAALATALLAAGAYAPHAQEKNANNVTVVTKNQAFPLKGARSLDACATAVCQDV